MMKSLPVLVGRCGCGRQRALRSYGRGLNGKKGVGRFGLGGGWFGDGVGLGNRWGLSGELGWVSGVVLSGGRVWLSEVISSRFFYWPAF